MDFSFHYYGTYCAAREAGFDNDDAWVIAHSAQFVDECSKTLLEDLGKKMFIQRYIPLPSLVI